MLIVLKKQTLNTFIAANNKTTACHRQCSRPMMECKTDPQQLYKPAKSLSGRRVCDVVSNKMADRDDPQQSPFLVEMQSGRSKKDWVFHA